MSGHVTSPGLAFLAASQESPASAVKTIKKEPIKAEPTELPKKEVAASAEGAAAKESSAEATGPEAPEQDSDGAARAAAPAAGSVEDDGHGEGGVAEEGAAAPEPPADEAGKEEKAAIAFATPLGKPSQHSETERSPVDDDRSTVCGDASVAGRKALRRFIASFGQVVLGNSYNSGNIGALE